jgi:hypothetical protein
MLTVVKKPRLPVMVAPVVSDWATLVVFLLDNSYDFVNMMRRKGVPFGNKG